jgi:hypothetical protein
MVNAINEEEETTSQDPDIAAFRPQPHQQQQQQYLQQQNSGYKGNQNQQRGKQNNKKFYPKKSNPSNTQGNTRNSGNGKFCCYCKILNHSQEECRKRMRDNKPCVTNQGRLYWPKINSMAENNDPNNVGVVFQ